MSVWCMDECITLASCLMSKVAFWVRELVLSLLSHLFGNGPHHSKAQKPPLILSSKNPSTLSQIKKKAFNSHILSLILF